MKIVNELLAPVGNIDAVKVAISNGADAIYCAGKKFGARSFIVNLTDEDIINASKYVHLHSKKIYITLNTFIFEEEFEEVKAYIDFLYQYVDAVIVQDYGIVHYIRSKYPDFPIHLSTQCSIHNINDIIFLRSLGVDRIVLAREVSLEEIKLFQNANVELEVFIHGALCFSYSGLCYLSYYKGGRSGNRGNCAQPCRQNYDLLEDGKTIKSGPLLSMKDLNTMNKIQELLKVGVTSLKIEGRAKSLEYLAMVTRIYRKLIDDFNSKKVPQVDEKDLEKLYSSFSRERTYGYLFNDNNRQVTTDFSVKHQGILIGKVISYKNKQVKIKLSKELNILDGIRIISNDKETGLTVTRIIENGNLVKSSTGTVIIDVKNYIEAGSDVFKTSSSQVIKEVKATKDIVNNEAKLDILIRQNKQIITITINEIKVNKIFTNALEKAKTINKEAVIAQFSKVNGLPIFYSGINYSNEDNLFIPIPLINEMRRELLDEIKEKLESQLMRNYHPYPFKLDESLFNKEKSCDELVLNEEINIIKKNNKDISIPSFHLSEIKKDSVISPYLGVCNSYAINFFRNMTSGVIVLSYESTLDNAITLLQKDKNIGYMCDFREPLMISNHCVVSKACGFDNKKCGMCLKHKYQLRDNDRIYDLVFNDCTMYIKGKRVIRNPHKDLINIKFKF